ncbi:MAG TPA: FAD-binding oxidoreductase [Bryobacteraceae bacterium]|jgi:FAD/FMN-containing dehydrogenase|nr:FAD-binding oxidoreductase [Bryobacteraceae bacterium]
MGAKNRGFVDQRLSCAIRSNDYTNSCVSPVPSQYLTDASGFIGYADDVFIPANEAEIVAILQTASQRCTPITVAGAGSGLTGARVPQGGAVLSLEKFRKLEIFEGYARVGAAVSLREIRDAAAPAGQFFAPDPTEIMASLGGAIATNASGSRSFRYGSTRRHIRALRVALMDGGVREYIRGDKIDFPVPPIAAPNTKKNTAGYWLAPNMDWIDLFCGSEGTLGVMLEAEIALLPLPQELFAGVIFFPSDEQALAAVDAWRPYPELRMLEYVDRNSLQLLAARYPEIPSEASAALLVEAEDADIDAWESRLSYAGALIAASWFATGPRDLERFRAFRHALPELVIETVVRRGFLKMGTDYAVPIDRNREMLAFYRQRLEQALPGRYVIYGHIGDGHVHVNMLPGNSAEAETAAELLTEFACRAIAFGGTISAEHGIGKRKAKLLSLQYTPEQIQAMKDVKKRLDPYGLLGRGTIFA